MSENEHAAVSEDMRNLAEQLAKSFTTRPSGIWFAYAAQFLADALQAEEKRATGIEFEKWVKACATHSPARSDPRNHFTAQLAARVRRETLEEAAKLVETARIVYRYEPYPHNVLTRNPVQELAEHIRALAPQEGTKP